MHPYLYQYISKLLNATVCLYCSASFNNNAKPLFTWSNPDSISDASVRYFIHQYIQLHLVDTPNPKIFAACSYLYYLFIPESEYYCLIGPLHLNGVLPCQFSLDSESATRYLEILSSQFSKPIKWSDHFIPCSLSDCIDAILLIYNLDKSGTKDSPFLTKNQIFSDNFPDISFPEEILKELSKTEFTFVENNIVHNPYQHEVRERTCIRNGDIEGLLKLQEIDYSNRFGKLSSSPVRNKIYHGIVAVAIACRSAIDGGLHPETAFHLSDITIQKLDNCKDIVSPVRIYKDAQLQYTKLVKTIKNQQELTILENKHVSLCKDYIFTHLHGKITVGEIAEAIGIDANYLSSLFRKCEKITLKQFILNEKIRLAKNLLIYSNYSYIQIATYLGFASQSHMGMEFKKITGMTPREYRVENTNEDFIAKTLDSN